MAYRGSLDSNALFDAGLAIHRCRALPGDEQTRQGGIA